MGPQKFVLLEKQSHSTHTEERICFMSRRQERKWFVAAYIQQADRHWDGGGWFKGMTKSFVLLILGWSFGKCLQQKFGAEQPDTLCADFDGACYLGSRTSICANLDSLSIPGHRRFERLMECAGIFLLRGIRLVSKTGFRSRIRLYPNLSGITVQSDDLCITQLRF